MKKIIVINGLPCSGKKTIGKKLAEKLDYGYFSLNEYIREQIEAKTELGLLSKKYKEANKEMPDEYIIPFIKALIIDYKKEGIIFNGFPKNISQAKTLNAFLYARKIQRVIPINLVSDLTIIRKRVEKASLNYDEQMSLYNSNQKPMIDFFKAYALKINVDDNIDNVLAEILEKL